MNTNARLASQSAEDEDAWQCWLDRHPEMFAALEPGARIGVVGRRDLGIGRGRMIVWQSDSAGMRARIEAFSGFGRCDADVLLSVDDRGQEALLRDGFDTARALARERHLQVFILRGPEDISRAGLDDFVDGLALAFPRH